MNTDVLTPAATKIISTPAATPAPASSPAAAPSPAVKATTSPASAAPKAPPASKVDPQKYSLREDYAKALLEEKMAAIHDGAAGKEAAEPAAGDPGAVEPEVGEPTGQSADGIEPSGDEAEAAPAPEAGDESPAQDVSKEEAEEQETEFELEPAAAVTPESLSQMIAGNAEFSKLLETDPKLKGQLYKTAREAAELKPYREMFPDLDSARAAQDNSTVWMDVRDTFLGSTTREGTLNALAKIAELSYERGENGDVILQNGQPVIGEDFYGFVDHVVGLDLEHRSADIEARLKANMYRSQGERERDESVKAALEILREENAAPSPAKEEMPEALRRKQEALDRRERELNERRHGAQVQERKSFEQGLQEEAQKRISDGIGRILANVEKQGAVVSPYLKNLLPKAIGAKLVRKIQANPTLQGQMKELQRLPIGDGARQRRLAAIDRAVQQYLPEVAREELREAGVQLATSAATKRAKVDAQIDTTKKTEPKGSTGPAGQGGKPLAASAAFDHARAEWQRSNPGRVFDNVAKEQILPRVLQLMSSW
ncbi:MAG TPA: hypothetical protein VGR96_15700 [Acidobacteriaceae bacterium]|nr:hypothetical protein [Acidobacteriaceae bacterium]